MSGNTFAQRRKKATAAEATVNLCLDLKLLDRFQIVYRELETLQLDSTPKDEQTTLDTPSITDQMRGKLTELTEARKAIIDASEPYVFRKLGRPRWRELVAEHPPTAEQVAEAQEERKSNPRHPKPNIDPETFWPEAIAASSLNPKLDVADVLWLRDGHEHDDECPEACGEDDWPGLPDAEFDRLTGAVQDLHSTGGDLPKESLNIAQILKLGLSGTTPAPEGSPSPSSTDASQKKASRTG